MAFVRNVESQAGGGDLSRAVGTGCRRRDGYKRVTCYAVSPELIDAGVEYEDVELIRDGNIASRLPQDLPVFSMPFKH